MLAELNDNAPVKDELATHDGIVYFPAELMPQDLLEDVTSLQHAAGGRGVVPPFILKSKKLNLKLKFKRSSLKNSFRQGLAKEALARHLYMTHRQSMGPLTGSQQRHLSPGNQGPAERRAAELAVSTAKKGGALTQRNRIVPASSLVELPGGQGAGRALDYNYLYNADAA
jgi:hypothetical protein|tara:strand:+ start:2336 stop:2845 length:510 start_codon:yes stop_codon:yes gene_type:complete